MKCNFGGLACPHVAVYRAVSQDVRNPHDSVACSDCAVSYTLQFDDLAFFLLASGQRVDPIQVEFRRVPDADA